MSDPVILFVRPNAISAKDKKLLIGSGVVVIEIDDPSNVKLVRAGTELSTTALLGAAAKTIRESSSPTTREAFGKAICALLETRATVTPEEAPSQT